MSTEKGVDNKMWQALKLMVEAFPPECHRKDQADKKQIRHNTINMKKL
jgi:hypothetical protein